MLYLWLRHQDGLWCDFLVQSSSDDCGLVYHRGRFVAAVSAGQEILWLRNLLSEFGYEHSSASKLRIDNLSALSFAKKPEHHGRMKHLDLRFYWLRDQVEAGAIAPSFVPTTEMPADILMKALPPDAVKRCSSMLGLEF